MTILWLQACCKELLQCMFSLIISFCLLCQQQMHSATAAFVSKCCTYTWDPAQSIGKLVFLTQMKFNLYWMHTILIQYCVSSPLISSTKNAHCDKREIKIIKNLSVNWLLQIEVTLYTSFTSHYCSDLFEIHIVHYGKFLPNCWPWCTYCPFNIMKSDAHLHDT